MISRGKDQRFSKMWCDIRIRWIVWCCCNERVMWDVEVDCCITALNKTCLILEAFWACGDGSHHMVSRQMQWV
jgi:hypothetical protein